MFSGFPQSELKIVAPDGTVRSVEKGILQSRLVVIQNTAAVIHVGDEIRRTLPNGVEETFEVVDPVYYGQSHTIPPHYQIKIRRKGSFPAGTGGHFTFNVSGHNARVNVGSNDHSRNIVAGQSVFGDLKSAIKSSPTASDEQSRLIALVEKMEAQADNKSSFLTAYQSFISSAANHMTIIAPFLPALTKFIA